jgi:hypothetical protein
MNIAGPVSPAVKADTRASLRPWFIAVVALVAIAVWIGHEAGASRSAVRWHTGNAYSTPGQIEVSAGGWSYDIPLDLQWEDNNGSFHESGRPACLPPTFSVSRVRFAEIDVKVEGTKLRQVVFVSCDG